ncbi:redox-sensing transcriptional repressor Rex [Egicoccus halophilus]|uniref:Redox-sensing transcriptional repressor Rex n=1 Tax=Egicoccus halophilus TaxID=1670830 RepID=A0A8J3EXF6_9ACTN|nr:redox-sensing transcriptional repressor Rex [Egicoccus halophilus]GGI05655.1 redox-sensing transcriptional repressor Rex [Egicoccus halophilus]
MTARRIPEATVARLPQYLQALVEAADAGRRTVSSEDLARASGLTSAKVRKDLSFLGSYGTRGVGYAVEELTTEISTVLGLTDDRPVVIVGIGNLGRALASYDGFSRRGFRVEALVDADPTKIGTQVGDHVVQPAAQLPDLVRDRGITIAVLATPAGRAQAVAAEVVAAGVTAILNFAPVHLDVPEHVSVRTVDLSTELQILSFYEQLGQVSAAAS